MDLNHELRPAPLPAHLQIFSYLHGAMRRDARRLVEAAERIPTHDRRQAEDLRRWYGKLREALGHHHRLEDEHFWPALRTHPDGPAVEAAMHVGHERLERSIDTVAAAFDRLVAAPPLDRDAARAALAAAARSFQDTLLDHLDDEERTALALLGTHLSVEEFAAVDRRSHRAAGVRYVAFALPWLLDELPPDDAAAIDGATPRVFRWLLRLWWQPRYRRLTQAVCR